MVTRAHIVGIQVSWTFYELNITSDAYCLTVLEQRERPEFHLSHRSRGHGYMPSKEPWPSTTRRLSKTLSPSPST